VTGYVGSFYPKIIIFSVLVLGTIYYFNLFSPINRSMKEYDSLPLL
jgi:hypothetical protein